MFTPPTRSRAPWLLFPMFAGVLLGVLATELYAQRPGPPRRPEPAITVSGTGTVNAKPDMAVIQVGVVTSSPTAIEALEANTAAVQKLFHVLDTHGIEEKDRQTSQFTVNPQYRHDPEGRRQPQVVAYEVRNQVTIKVRDLTKLGALLDELVREGANNVSGISFTLAEPTELLDEARRKAIDDARRKADLYAKAAGLTLGKVLTIHEQGAVPPQPLMRMGVEFAMPSSVPVAAGEQEFQATVTVGFAAE